MSGGRIARGGLVAASVLAALAAVPSAAHAYERMVSRKGAELEWKQRCVSYAIDERGSETLPVDTVEQVFARSFQTWMDVRCDGEPTDFEVRQLGRSRCRDAEYRRSSGNVSTVAFVDDWEDRCREPCKNESDFYDPSAFAVTTVWHTESTGEILDVDIQLNEQLGPFADCPLEGCPEPAPGERQVVDLGNVATHEIGHYFGLGHTDISIATMAPNSPRGETDKRILRTDDIDGFCAIYPPGSLPETCDFQPENGLDLDCEDGGGKCTASGPGQSGPGTLPLLLLLLTLRKQSRLRSMG